jgi:uncharacterized membrane protein
MDILLDILGFVAFGIGIVGIAVIVWGVIIGLVEVARAEFSRFRAGKQAVTLEHIRYDMGFHLLLGLEFLIAADIVRTIIRPSLEELAILGAIVAIRTVISYFLGKEIGQLGEKP